MFPSFFPCICILSAVLRIKLIYYEVTDCAYWGVCVCVYVRVCFALHRSCWSRNCLESPDLVWRTTYTTSSALTLSSGKLGFLLPFCRLSGRVVRVPDLRSTGRTFESRRPWWWVQPWASCLHTHVPLSPSSIIRYQPMGGAASQVTAGLTESNGSHSVLSGCTLCGLLMPYLLSMLHVFHSIVTNVSGYWHQRADERHGNPPPR